MCVGYILGSFYKLFLILSLLSQFWRSQCIHSGTKHDALSQSWHYHPLLCFWCSYRYPVKHVLGRGTRDQIANIHWIIEKAREFQKNIYFGFIDYTKTFDCVDQNQLWKIPKEMGIPDHFTCLLRNLYAGQEATVRTGHGITNWFQTRRGVRQGCILSPCLFNSMQSTWSKTPGWMKHKLESRLPGEISITDIQMTPPLWQKVKNWSTTWWKWKRGVKKLS